VLIADDDANVLGALAEVIAAAGGMTVVALAGDADEAIEAAVREALAVAILDVKMPAGGGARAAREIAARAPGVRVVALSAHDDRESVASMLRAGALGYLVKGAPIDEIIEAVERAARGLASLSGEVVASVAGELEEQLGAQERRAEDREARVDEVQAALQPGAIRPVFQPIVDLETGDVVGYEALARFELEPRQPPDAWFRAAAEVGLLEDLEFAALRPAVARFADLPRGTYLSLNISPASALSDRLSEALVGIPPGAVVLEVTEHAEVADYDALRAALAPIRLRGGRLAVDDAGSGFASLRHILLLEPSIIKVDISITRDVDSDRARRALASALVSFGREMEISLIAEGIETAAELEALRALGVRHGQGYFLGRPTSDPIVPLGVRG
jgi:EAL domain-containing protein (putative c-di-GMP-specific phosphodiesterase class I)/DNA-binding NarL/FixJ family response regulator